MRPPRGPLGPGALLLFAAMVVIPEVLRQCKPFAKTVGETVVKLGEGIQRLADTESPCCASAEGAVATTGGGEPATEVVAEAMDSDSAPAAAEDVPPTPERPKKAGGRKKPTQDASST